MASRRLQSCLTAVALVAPGGCYAVDRTSADRFTASGEMVALSGGDAGAAFACFTCHGLDGRGDGAGTPRLAGLDRGYLEAQLDAYATGRRQHEAMAYLATRLPWRDRQLVSAYYAQLPFAAGPMPAEAPPALYAFGDPGRGLQPCAACHGAAGEGVGAGNPPLGGQSAFHLAEQIDQWRRSERRSDPDNVMLEISRRLQPEEIRPLAAYAASLPGGPPSPQSPAASPSAHRAGPRNDVSGQRPHEAAR